MIGVFLAKKAIADAYKAMNQRNVSKFLSALSDDVTLMYPGEVPQSGTFKGKGALEVISSPPKEPPLNNVFNIDRR
jgi:ketosteroid isomerase-like protein